MDGVLRQCLFTFGWAAIAIAFASGWQDDGWLSRVFTVTFAIASVLHLLAAMYLAAES